MLGRREILILLGGAALARPADAQAQRARRDSPARVAALFDLASVARDWFSNSMRDRGWMEGRDFVLVPSELPPGDYAGLDAAAARVVAGKPDLVFASGTAAALAVRRITTTVPIVMWLSGYPVEAGLAESLARPGKNVTGNATYVETQIWSKLLELLREVKPESARVGVLWTYVPPAFPAEEIEPCYAELRVAERALGLKVHIAEAATLDDLPRALRAIDAQRPDALLLTGGLPFASRNSIMRFAVSRRLATITDYRWGPGVEVPPLLSYAPALRDLMQSAVGSVVKILEGERPGDLPIQRPTRFELIVNAKTARAIGITIPQSILIRADEVVE